nr:type VI secretion system baseplate subunit TssF [uncultured Rhodopila sp.]
MFDAMLPYYLTELQALQADTAEFAKAYPSQAALLRIPANVGTEPVGDPHVERLLEGVAFLGARVQHRLDDEFPELTDALLSVLYPHHLAPFPSCLVAGFPARAGQDGPAAIQAGTMLETNPLRGEICRFRTTAPVTVWPVEITQARLSGMPLPAPDNPYARSAVSVLQLTLRCTTKGLTFDKLGMDRLRFFLGSPDQASVQLYELLAARAVSVAFTGHGAAPVIPAEASLQPVGFEPEEALLPWDKRGFSGFRLLSEYFGFPHKFMFIDLCGIPSAGFGETMEVYVYLDQEAPELARSVNARSLQLGCAPAVNLFPMTCDPITLDHTQTEYLVTPDRRRMDALEVWSITGVRETREGGVRPWRPFYRLTPGHGATAAGPSYLTIRREAQAGSDVWIAPCDPALDPDGSAATRLSVDALCSNRDLPRQLPVDAPLRVTGGGSGIEGARAVTAATAPLRPRLREKRFWRLISHLALGHLSLTGDDTAHALREVLRLYNLDDSERAEAAISALQAIAQRPYSARAPGNRVGAFCRGLEVDLIFAARQWQPLGLFLMASVLARFLPLQGQVNSFVRTRALLSGKQAPVAAWPPRAGGRVLL